MGFSKLKDYVKGGYSSARESVQKKIHDQKKKAALDVLSEMGMRANVSQKEEEKIVNPAYDLIFTKYAKGGDVNGEYVVVGIPDLKKLTTLTKLEFVLDNKFYEIKDVNDSFVITDKGNVKWEDVSDRKFPDEDGVMIAFGENLDNFFMFKLTDEERAAHPYNNWMHAKADFEDAWRDMEDAMMEKGGSIKKGWTDIHSFRGENAEKRADEYIQNHISYWKGEVKAEELRKRFSPHGGEDYKGEWVVQRMLPVYEKGGTVKSKVIDAVNKYEEYVLSEYYKAKASINNSDHRNADKINNVISEFTRFSNGYHISNRPVHPSDVTDKHIKKFFGWIKKDIRTSINDADAKYIVDEASQMLHKFTLAISPSHSEAAIYSDNIADELVKLGGEEKYANGGSVGRTYRLIPYKDMSVPNMIEPVYEKTETFTGDYDDAIAKAQQILDSDSIFRQVNINRVGKTILASKKAAVVSSKGVTRFENGGIIQELQNKWDVINEQVKFAVVRAVGLDVAIRHKNREYIVSPYRLLESAVYKNMLAVKEIDKKVFYSAIAEANSIEETYRDSGEGIGSSDMNHFIKSFLDDAELKTAWVKNSLQRVDANGKVITIKNDLPSSTMFEDGGFVGGFAGGAYVVRGNDGDFLSAGYDKEDGRLYSFGSDHTRASLFTRNDAEWVVKAINDNQPQFKNTVIFNSKPYIQKYSEVINNAPLIKKFFWWW